MQQIGHWLAFTPTWITGIFLFATMLLAAYAGTRLRAHRKEYLESLGDDGSGPEGYVVSGVLGLLALLLGFTFSIAVDRFDARRVMVLEEANAIGTAYLRSQLLGEPHRSRMSGILKDYTENRVVLAESKPDDENRIALIKKNDALLVDLWSATAASFDSIRDIDFSSALVESVNTVIDDDSARKAARLAHVPLGVFVALYFYILISACMLGYVLGESGPRRRMGASVFILLLAMSMVLIIDIDKPTTGWVRESQLPMILLRNSIRAQPPGSYDRWRSGAEHGASQQEPAAAP
ncbi:MAG: hypothetical protein ABWZ75_09260 [Novosphingobium sp.]